MVVRLWVVVLVMMGRVGGVGGGADAGEFSEGTVG